MNERKRDTDDCWNRRIVGDLISTPEGSRDCVSRRCWFKGSEI
jgi:hypothetical protein